MAPSPPVIVTTDLDGPHPPADPATPGSAPVTPQRNHRRQDSQMSDPSHLSPATAHGMSFASHSPTPSVSTALTPPSPTLTSSSSVHFNDDQSQAPSPTDGLSPIGENGDYKSHTRDSSFGTWSSNSNANPDLTPINTLDLKNGGKTDDPEKKVPEYTHVDPDKDTSDPTPFHEKPSRLAMLVDPKNLDDLEKIGGVESLLDGLGVDPSTGLTTERNAGAPRSSSDIAPSGEGQWHATLDDRRRVYGRNDLPERKSKSLWELMWMAFKDKVLIILSVAAVVSLALGLYQDLGTDGEEIACDVTPDHPDGLCAAPKVDWVEGVAIVVAILIVVLVGSINDWQKERQFKKLNEKRDDRTVKVVRDGNEQVINVRDVVVGDIAILEPGEIVPVDGIFLKGHNVRCDESGATGESDAIKKVTYSECIAEREQLEVGKHAKNDCFMISGSKVLEGVGSYVVISVGTYSFNGRIMMSMRGDSEETPLQIKLNGLAELIAKAGAGAGLILFTALMIRFFVTLGTNPNEMGKLGQPATPNDKAQAFIQILIISVTLVVVAVPEGLPLAVTLALAFATKRMTKQNLLVRVLGSCETMGHATVICTDKTGTLTQNVMSVVAGSLGVHGKFVRDIKDNQERSIADVEGASREDFSFDMDEMNSIASPELQNLFNDAICINSTAFEDKDEDGKLEFVGSKTETALLRFAQEEDWANWKTTRDGADIVQMIPFSSELKAMGVVVRLSTGGFRLYVKGASEVLTKVCTHYVDVQKESPVSGVQTKAFDEITTRNIEKTIIFYANQTLRTLAICYRDFESWPPADAPNSAVDDVPFSVLARDLSLIAVVGIEDPLRPGVREAVAECQGAGVAVKMCTGDNVLTARSIAKQCGIFSAGGIIMEGPVFRKLSDADRDLIVPRLQILARSSPEDKKLLVKSLKAMGEVVGVTGDGTNDGPALKLANVGFAMGITGTEVAKEASDIILMDDSFSNIVLAIMWGRCVNDSVKKFIQFQISVNITAVVITFVSAVASASESSVLTAVQLLWVNLIMDTFAALALATDPATRSLLKRKPDRKDAPLITVDMWKMIIIQAIYQIVVCLVLHFAGRHILNMPWGTTVEQAHSSAELRTLVFNCFVFCQIFNQLNCRRLDRHFNVLEGFFRNYWFISIFIIMVGGQILIIEVGGAAFTVQRLGGRDWAISIIVGFIALPLGAIVRMIPTEPIERLLVKWKLYPDPDVLPVTVDDSDSEDGFIYNPALEKVRDNLSTFARLRGGRLSGSSIVARNRHAQLRKANIQLPSLLAMVPTLVAGGIGAGHSWVSQTNALGLRNPAAQDASRSTTDLYAGRVQLHPDTDPNDPLYAKFGLEPPSRTEKTAQQSSPIMTEKP